MIRRFAFTGLLAAAIAVSGCTSTVISGSGTCTAGGQTYQVGATFPAPDGCNTCTCGADGSAACTEIACDISCFYQGSAFPNGSSFPAGDGCNTCSCEGGVTACTHQSCADGCSYGGQVYQPGDTFPEGDGCNTCQCTTGGGVACTGSYCPPALCVYAGTNYKVGAQYPAGDGCNTCVCQPDGSSACTDVACACNPAAEWERSYVGTSPAQCAVIDYVCKANTTAFSNACGCGCEQAASCPEYFDCMPPKSCDVNALLAMCPYSKIAI